VVTLGAEGSRIHVGGATIHVPAVRPSALVDPTAAATRTARRCCTHGAGLGLAEDRPAGLAAGLDQDRARGGRTRGRRDLVAAMYAKEFGSDLW